MTKIKFCGITSLDDAEAAIDLGADMLGFNFYPRSSRAISRLDAQTIVRALPASVETYGVFVNAERAEVLETARSVGLSGLQFHGDESLEYFYDWDAWKVIKAVRVGNPETDSQLELFATMADFLLLDRFSDEAYGGTGEEIEDSRLAEVFSKINKEKLILAGGLNAENVAEKVQKYQPYAVDTASGIERAPGRKSLQLMSAFSAAVRAVDRLSA